MPGAPHRTDRRSARRAGPAAAAAAGSPRSSASTPGPSRARRGRCPERISSRRNKGLPALTPLSQRNVSRSTGPPSRSRAMSAAASSDSGSRSTRIRPASFHSEVTASGARDCARTVASTRTRWRVTSCSSSAADAGSRRWASSTISASGPRLARRSPAVRSTSSRSPDASGARSSSPASAPNGTVDAASVASTNSTAIPRVPQPRADRARRVTLTDAGVTHDHRPGIAMHRPFQGGPPVGAWAGAIQSFPCRQATHKRCEATRPVNCQ